MDEEHILDGELTTGSSRVATTRMAGTRDEMMEAYVYHETPEEREEILRSLWMGPRDSTISTGTTRPRYEQLEDRDKEIFWDCIMNAIENSKIQESDSKSEKKLKIYNKLIEGLSYFGMEVVKK